MKKDNVSKFLSIIVILSMIINCCFVSFAETGNSINAVLNGNTVNVSGKVNPGEFVNIFLLNPDKTVTDLNNATTDALYKATVNYSNIETATSSGSFSDEFPIKDFSEENKYLLYVKTETQSYERWFAPAKKIYVSTTGNDDTGDGTQENPYASIEGAKNAISKSALTSPIEVIIAGGTYNLTKGISFNSTSSGTKDYPITYKAADGEKVILKGTTKLDISKAGIITEAEIIEKFQSDIVNKIITIDLAEQGISAEVARSITKLQAGYAGKPAGIYLNGDYQTIARWPNTGYETILSGSTKGGSMSDNTTDEGGATVKISNLDTNRAALWAKNTGDLYVEGYLCNDWYKEWAKVGSVNSDTPSVTLDTYTRYGVGENYRIAVVNTPAEIDIPGEWYIDDNSILYYYPPHKLTNADTLEIATLTDNFITIQDGGYLNFEGIEFTKNVDDPNVIEQNSNKGNGIVVKRSANVNIKNCIFSDIGIDGVVIENTTNSTVDGCLMHDMGYSAVSINCGDRVTQTAGNVVVSNSVISDINRDSSPNNYAGIRLNGVGNIVENNIFHNIKNSAVRYGGNGHFIRNNEIYNTVNDAADAGAIYAGRSWSEYGTSIENNYFHDIGLGYETEYLASAVFWDDLHSGNTFKNNIVKMNSKIATAAVKIGGGRDNFVDSNIFAYSMYGVLGEDRTVKPTAEGFYESTVFQTFKHAANKTDANDITEADWLESYMSKYSAIKTNYDELKSGTYTRANTITNNKIYDCSTDISMQSKMSASSTNTNNTSISSADVDTALANMTNLGVQGEVYALDELKSFNLVYPANNANIAKTTMTLKWSKSAYADSYRYEVSTSNDFSTSFASGTTTANIVTIDGLELDKTYYWKVTAVNNSKQIGGEYTSAVSMFTTNGELTIDEITYDSTTDTVTLKATNTKIDEENITMIVTVKESNGKLISAKPYEVKILAGESKTITADDFGTVNPGNNVEVFVWKSLSSMVNLTNKKPFTKPIE